MSLRLDRSSGDNTQALGRSRGGLGSKIVGVCDAAGRLVDFVVVAGQAHELAPSLLLLRRLPKAPAWALADMACDAQEFRLAARKMGAIPVFRRARAAGSRSPVRPISIAIVT
jgi:putative transposase